MMVSVVALLGSATIFLRLAGPPLKPQDRSEPTRETNRPPVTTRFVAPRNRALLIYTDSYQRPLSTLPNTKVDAVSLQKMLVSAYGYEAQLLANPSMAQVKDALRSMSYLDTNRVLDQDQLIVYIAGHGMYVPGDGGYLLFKNAKPEEGTDTLPVDVFLNRIAATAYQRIFVIIDTCDAGLFTESEHRGIKVPPGEREPYDDDTAYEVFKTHFRHRCAYFLAPGDGDIPDGDPKSREGSPFCRALVNVLGEGKTLRVFDVSELSSMIRRRGIVGVRKGPLNMRKNEEKGEFLFVYKPLLDKWKGKTAGLAPHDR